MLISRVLLSIGMISILGAIFNVVYVAYFIRSQLNLFPVQLILSPILASIGAASLTAFFNRANLSSGAHRFYSNFKQKTQSKAYLDNANKGFWLLLFSLIAPTMTDTNSGPLRLVIQSNLFYAVANLMFVALFLLVVFAITAAKTDHHSTGRRK